MAKKWQPYRRSKHCTEMLHAAHEIEVVANQLGSLVVRGLPFQRLMLPIHAFAMRCPERIKCGKGTFTRSRYRENVPFDTAWYPYGTPFGCATSASRKWCDAVTVQ
jgi:hypothetical protein